MGGGVALGITIYTNSLLPSGKVGELYNGKNKGLEISISDIPSYAMNVLSVIDRELPPGMEINGVYNSICGTPTKSGTYTFTLKATYGDSVTKEFSITILKNPEKVKPTIVKTFADGTINEPYSSEIEASNGDGSTYEWDYSGTLPPGLILGSMNGYNYQLSGTPTSEGTYDFTVYLWDKYEPENGKASKTFTVTIGDGSTPTTPGTTGGTDTPGGGGTTTTSPLNITGTLINGLVGIPYGDSTSGTSKDIYVMATGGKAPYYWRTEGNFPPESEIKGYISGASSEYVVLKGTPKKSATYDFTIFVKDANNTEKSKNFSITINEQTEENIAQYNDIVNTYTENKAVNVDAGGDSPTIVNVYKGGTNVNIEGEDTNLETNTDRNKDLSLSSGGSGGCEAGLGFIGFAVLAVMLAKRPN